MRNEVEQNGLMIVRTPSGIAIGNSIPLTEKTLTVEVERPVESGKFLKTFELNTRDMPFRDYYGSSVDHLALGIRVKDGEKVVAELLAPEGGPAILPFMKRSGPQQHITENWVSVPPALHITDDVGAVWTLGFATAPMGLSPHGEFAFDVLRDGVPVNEVASRIERRNSKIRVFTRHGWKRWNGREFN